MGIGKDGEPTESFQLGMELHGKYTIFAEGARGSLGRQLISRFSLDAGRTRRATPSASRSCGRWSRRRPSPGLVIHTAGWPLDPDTYGGSFLYHLDNNQVTLGFVVGLDYTNPWMSPFEEMQRWKTHPEIRKTLEGGKRLGYGARALTAGGILSLPKTVFPGGAFVGCEAGYLNSSRIKGTMPRSRPACSPPKPRSRRWSPGGAATSSRPTRPRSTRAGCAKSWSARATSSSGSRGVT
jgi:electron-transferring-flavoprotein dehydrogenase